MIQLEANAQRHLEHYLEQVRAYLRGCRSVDPAEVDRDVREHIERELAEKPEPVSFNELEAVLKRLGSPAQWVPEQEISLWRKTLVRLRTGPEDWRLSYLSFGLLVLGLLFWPMGLVLIAASFCVSRAALSIAGDPDELQGQKWLLYPSLLVVYALVLFGLLVGPLVALLNLADAVENSNTIGVFPWTAHDDLAYWPIALMLVAALTGLWWFLLGCARRLWPRLFDTVFRPFSQTLKPTVLSWFMGIAASIFVLGAVAGGLMVKYPAWYAYVGKNPPNRVVSSPRMSPAVLTPPAAQPASTPSAP